MPRLSLRILLLLALPLTAYSFMLPAGFKTMDDQVSIVANPLIRNAANAGQLFTQGYFRDNSYYRPLANLTFMGEFHAFGLNPFFYNLDNLLIHIANVFLVWMLASRLTGNPVVGFWAGLMFAVHPVHWEAVANISGRAVLLCAFFSFTSFLFFLTAYARRRTGWLIVSLAAFATALLSKENAAVLPGVFFLYLVYARGKAKDFALLLPYAVIVGAYLLLRQNIGMTEFYQWHGPDQYILGFITFLRSVLTDIRLFFVPTDLHFDRSLPVFLSFAQPQAMTTMFVWMTAVSWLFIGRKHISALVWMCLAWFALELLPVSQIVTTVGVGVGCISTAEHFLYTASVPAFILMALGGMKLYGLIVQKRILTPVVLQSLLAALVVFWMGVTVEQNIYATSEIAMIERSLRMQPYNARLNFSAGIAYVPSGRFKQAEAYFRAAAAYDPFEPRYQIALGKSLCDQGRVKECIGVYDGIKDPGSFKDFLNDNRRGAQALLTHADLSQK